MHLIIHIDEIDEVAKREWLLNTLRLMDIKFETANKRQTLAEYNFDIDKAEAEINEGKFVSAEDFKKEASQW